jgi:hypothetical protein
MFSFEPWSVLFCRPAVGRALKRPSFSSGCPEFWPETPPSSSCLGCAGHWLHTARSSHTLLVPLSPVSRVHTF